jgi:Flp pilus assembly protein TadD
LTGNLQIRESSTGKIISQRNISQDVSAFATASNQWPEDPDKDAMQAQAINMVGDYFMKWIAPYTEYESVTFETDSKLPELKECEDFAKIGNWPEAIKKAKKATEINPLHAGAWWNLGVSYKYSSMFKEAEVAFRSAYKIDNKRANLEQIASLEKLIAEKKQLEEQKYNETEAKDESIAPKENTKPKREKSIKVK